MSVGKASFQGFQGSEDRAREPHPGSAAHGWEAHVHKNTATRRSFSASRLRLPLFGTVRTAPCPPTSSLAAAIDTATFLPLVPGTETNVRYLLTFCNGTRAASQDHAPRPHPRSFLSEGWEQVQRPERRRGASRSRSQPSRGGAAPPPATGPFPCDLLAIREQSRPQTGSTFISLLKDRRRLPLSRVDLVAS